MNNIKNLMKPKFLFNPIEESWDINELKIKYTQIIKINITGFFFKNKKFCDLIKISINEISINNILIKEIVGPIIIAMGIKEKSERK